MTRYHTATLPRVVTLSRVLAVAGLAALGMSWCWCSEAGRLRAMVETIVADNDRMTQDAARREAELEALSDAIRSGWVVHLAGDGSLIHWTIHRADGTGAVEGSVEDLSRLVEEMTHD